MAITASSPLIGAPDELIDDALDQPVALVQWPDDDARRVDLALRGRPRLLLLEPDTSPPLTWDDSEDWVRLPVDPAELLARARNLLRHAPAPKAVPILDADGLVRLGADWVALPPIEARMFAVLVQRIHEVVRKEDLLAAGWPDGIDDPNIVYGRMRLLRGRLAPLGLRIETVRGVGFLLEHA